MCSERAAAVAVMLLFCTTVAPADAAAAKAARLVVRPSTCVALHRGQVCYERVLLSWSVPDAGRFCLLLDGAAEPLVCWAGDARTEWLHEYASRDTERYSLVSTAVDGTVIETLANASVDTAWVYRGRRRGASGWRLF